MPTVLHASWLDGSLHLWREDGARVAQHTAPTGEPVPEHPFADGDLPEHLAVIVGAAPRREITLRLPAAGGAPRPSPQLELSGASQGADDADDGVDIDFEDPTVGMDEEPAPPPAPEPAAVVVAPTIQTFRVNALAVDAARAGDVLLELADTIAENGADVRAGGDFEYWVLCARFARTLLAQERLVPMLVQDLTGELRGSWRPWLSDEATAKKAAGIVASMPAIARAGVDAMEHGGWAMTSDFLGAVTDAWARRALEAENFIDAVEGRDTAKDAPAAWLSGLLSMRQEIPSTTSVRQDIAKRVRMWIAQLEERGASSAWRLLFRLREPDLVGLPPDAAPSPDEPAWVLHFCLQSAEQPALIVEGSDIWLLSGESATIMGRTLHQPQELLLKELGRASRLYRRLEAALNEQEPAELRLNTRQAYDFLREVRPVLLEQGFGVQSPDWWDSPQARVGAKLRLESQLETDPRLAPPGLSGAGKPQLGLATLVNYTWDISVGDMTLSLDEFESLAARRVPLVRVNGRWVEVRPEDVHAAIKFIRENPGGTMRLSEAMRMVYSSDLATTGIPVVGMEATGWLQAFFNSEAASKQLELLPPPRDFKGTLRPYQARGVSWMMFQERLGFGLCLADDMGLGKTVQLLALLAYEREGAEPAAEPAETPAQPATTAEGGILTSLHHGVQPTLLLVPMSVVGNWQHETKRFCPHLKLLVHHGPDRNQGEAFYAAAANADLVITTYALAHRDREMLERVKWGRVVLDEAQYIKNPSSKQSQAARAFEADHRVALTGTPVENRLTELWSIMDFLNPGYLGGASSFRTRFGVPIERYHDKSRAEKLRGLIRPFVLRRLKSDPTIIADLPAKVETKEFSHLTSEQAALYEQYVKRMLAEVDQAEGIQRRGMVLSALIRLKQVCNHPAQVLKDWDESTAGAPDPVRSGKCIRLLEMLDETLAEGDQSLIFTQFRVVGRMLETMIRQRFGREVLFIHGGVPQARRQQIIDLFQRRGEQHPVLILSLRAGGVGLNLTAATHVFHFDRWWNPAVENQATDRAYRIGQTRTVQVHKFVVRGTLEERIDSMIESKLELAQDIIGDGEAWLSELSTDQLRDVLSLRNDAVDDLD